MKSKELTRREFLKILAAKTVALVGGGCTQYVPDSTERSPVSMPTPSSTLTAEPFALRVTGERPVVIDYQPKAQLIEKGIDSNNNVSVIGCQPPLEPESEIFSGFGSNETPFDWSKLRLPTINMNGRLIPILTSRTDVDARTISFLEQWYADPSFFNWELAKLGTPELDPTPIDTLVVHYKNVRNDYWLQDEDGTCNYIFDDSPTNDPMQLFNQFSSFVAQSTNNLVSYRLAGNLTITESELPMTSDPNHTYQRLIDVYGRTINYQTLAELAVNNGISNVMVYGGPAGMYESRFWEEQKTGKSVLIFGFNYDRTYECCVHSWMHYVESALLGSHLKDMYLLWAGRDQEYSSLPDSSRYSNLEQYLQNEDYLHNTQEYVAAGFGTTHLGPNSIAHYKYDANIPVLIPGRDFPIDRDLWGGNVDDEIQQELNYYNWWIRSLPQAFLSTIKF